MLTPCRCLSRTPPVCSPDPDSLPCLSSLIHLRTAVWSSCGVALEPRITLPAFPCRGTPASCYSAAVIVGASPGVTHQVLSEEGCSGSSVPLFPYWCQLQMTLLPPGQFSASPWRCDIFFLHHLIILPSPLSALSWSPGIRHSFRFLSRYWVPDSGNCPEKQSCGTHCCHHFRTLYYFLNVT